MDGKGFDPLLRMTKVQADGKQRIRRLRLTVGKPFMIGAVREVRVSEIHRGKLMRP